jgi:hypothetical protein
LRNLDERSAKSGNQSAVQRLARIHTPGPAASTDQERVGARAIGIRPAAVRVARRLIDERNEGGDPARALIHDRPFLVPVALWILTDIALLYR